MAGAVLGVIKAIALETPAKGLSDGGDPVRQHGPPLFLSLPPHGEHDTAKPSAEIPRLGDWGVTDEI